MPLVLATMSSIVKGKGLQPPKIPFLRLMPTEAAEDTFIHLPSFRQSEGLVRDRSFYYTHCYPSLQHTPRQADGRKGMLTRDVCLPNDDCSLPR